MAIGDVGLGQQGWIGGRVCRKFGRSNLVCEAAERPSQHTFVAKPQRFDNVLAQFETDAARDDDGLGVPDGIS